MPLYRWLRTFVSWPAIGLRFFLAVVCILAAYFVRPTYLVPGTLLLLNGGLAIAVRRRHRYLTKEVHDRLRSPLH